MLRETKVIYLNHRSKLKVSAGDADYMLRRCGEYRWIHNHVVLRQERILRLSSSVEDLMDIATLRRLLARESRKPGMEWLREAPRDVLDYAIEQVHRGYWLYLTQKHQGFKGYERNRPQLRHRSSSKEHYTLTKLRIEQTTSSTGKPRLAVLSLVDGHRYEFFEGDLLPVGTTSAMRMTVKREFGQWFATLQLRHEMEVLEPSGEVLGVDPGLSTMAHTSDGTVYESWDLPEGQQRRLRNLYRELGRQTPGSSNHQRTQVRIDKLRSRRRSGQDDAHHKASSGMVGVRLSPERRPRAIVIDSLNLTRIAEEGHTRAVKRERLLQLLLKMKTKCQRHGVIWVEADPLYPSSQVCSVCGMKNPLVRNLSVREWECPECHSVHNRDVNAAKNLAAYPLDREHDWREMLARRNADYLDSLPSIEEPSWVEGDYLDHELQLAASETASSEPRDTHSTRSSDAFADLRSLIESENGAQRNTLPRDRGTTEDPEAVRR